MSAAPKADSACTRYPMLEVGLRQMRLDGVRRALKACRERPEKVLVRGDVVLDDKT